MIPVTLGELARVVSGQLVPESAADVLVTAPVVTDSREAAPGSLYVARIGEHADGHQFVAGAAANGAVAALVLREVPDAGIPQVVVADTNLALARVARHVVDSVPGLTIVGITGSSGKTSTKDLLAHVLRRAGETLAPVGSYNSEVGLPLTVARLEPTTRFLVAEMGASKVGDIDYLTAIAPPQIGIVLNVGTAHLGEFGSRENIARAKSELVTAVPEDGLVVLNADDPVVSAMAEVARGRVLRVGRAEDADLRAVDVRLVDGHAELTMRTPAGERPVRLGLHGEHQVGNALAVTAAALELGLDLDELVAALADAAPASRWRMEVHQLDSGVTLVNDAYNANPDSMRAALTALASMGQGRRTLAVLGQMLELGDEHEALHALVGERVAAEGIDRLVTVGPGTDAIVEGFLRAAGTDEAQVLRLGDADEAVAVLGDELRDGDVVLLKSSRDAGLRHVGDRLCGLEAPCSPS